MINGIEDETISTSSALLQCMKIARLMDDEDAEEWLSYEYGGYPRTRDGKYIEHKAYVVGREHGRELIESSGNRHIFIELSDELESIVNSDNSALGNFTTQGMAVDGQQAVLSVDRLTQRISQSIASLRQDIKTCEKRLSILKGQYYNFAVKWYIQLQFSNAAESAFNDYQERVDNAFSKLSKPTLQKLQVIQDQLQDDDNPEHYSQILTSCRRLWEAVANELFEKYYPNYSQKKYKTDKTVSGKENDVSSDHFNNRMSAVIEHLQSKSAKNTLVGSEITYLLDWTDNIFNKQNSGVHADVSKNDAEQCIMQTYIFLGDLMGLAESQEVNSSKVSTNES